MSLLAASLSQVKNLTWVGVALPIVIALIIVKFAVSAMVRSIVLLIAISIGVFFYTQRSSLQTCYDNALANMEAGQATVQCKVAGFSVDLDLAD